MDSDMQKSCEALGIVDKGLRAESLEEKMELLVNLKSLMRETPIPYFINATVLRLLEAFRHNDNALRNFIVQILGECSAELGVVYSKAEITRRLMRISYSNDSLTRAFNLRLLATLSTVISENKRVHHLIMKSVDCEHKDERAAAIVAMNAFATASKRFSEMALRKMQQVVKSSKCSLRLKVYVVRVIAHVHGDDETIVNAVDVGEKILFETPNKYIACAVIASLTQIVRTRHIAMPRLMNVLLRFQSDSSDGRSLLRIILQSVKALAPAADLLSGSTVQDICELSELTENREERLLWLGAIRCLVVQKVRSVNTHINEYMMQRSSLLFDKDGQVRLMAVQVFVCLYSFMPSLGVASLLQTTFLEHMGSTSSDDSEKFYRLLTAFVRMKACPSEVVYSLVDASFDSPLPDGCVPQLLQFLIASAETHSELCPRLFKWALQKFEQGDYSNVTLFARLIYAPGVDLNELPPNHWNAWGTDAWTSYLVARTAMRNGHLKSVALPILEMIEHKAACAENRLWLSSLKSICMATVEEFKLSELERAISNYDQAICTLEMLSAKKWWRNCFWFAERYVDCLRSSLTALRRLIVTRNFTLLPLIVVGPPSQQWKVCATSMMECYEKWHTLLRQSYDADSDTIVSLDLKCFECSLMCAALMWLVEEDSQLYFDSCSESLSSLCTSATNVYLRELAEWGKAQLDVLKLANVPLEKRLSYQYISHLMNIFGRFCCGPVFLPRFFFEQLKRTELKLSVSPQASEDAQSSEEPEAQEESEVHDEFNTAEQSDLNDESSCLKVTRGSEVPFVVEATMTSTSSCSIRTFIVNITVTCKEGSRVIRSWSEAVTSEEENCFKAPIPYLPQEDCTVKFTVEFVDESRRHWTSHSQAEVKIVLKEDDYEERRRPETNSAR
ncbi:Integrator complex subunit 7 [Toxocara canis]|uniref:Integrator complex subunit 7 n=1 Tax=Toxocara canis TaxID=6265 RepID=A0A0B2UV17_TOXCA|nr:Integrator complex subunit 7 [Toxocara canis]